MGRMRLRQRQLVLIASLCTAPLLGGCDDDEGGDESSADSGGDGGAAVTAGLETASGSGGDTGDSGGGSTPTYDLCGGAGECTGDCYLAAGEEMGVCTDPCSADADCPISPIGTPTCLAPGAGAPNGCYLACQSSDDCPEGIACDGEAGLCLTQVPDPGGLG